MKLQAALTALLVAEGCARRQEILLGKRISSLRERQKDLRRNKKLLLIQPKEQQKPLWEQVADQGEEAPRPLWEDAAFVDLEDHPEDLPDLAHLAPCDVDVGILACEPGYTCTVLGKPDDGVKRGRCVPHQTASQPKKRYLQETPTQAPSYEEFDLCEQIGNYIDEYTLSGCTVTGFQNGSTVGVLDCSERPILICDDCTYTPYPDPDICARCYTNAFVYECDADGANTFQFCDTLVCSTSNTCAAEYCVSGSYDSDGALVDVSFSADGVDCPITINGGQCPDDIDTPDLTATCPNFVVNTCEEYDILGDAICDNPFPISGVTGQEQCLDDGFIPPPPPSPVTTVAPPVTTTVAPPPVTTTTVAPPPVTTTTVAPPPVTTTTVVSPPVTTTTVAPPPATTTITATTGEPPMTTETALGQTSVTVQGDNVDVPALESTMESFLSTELSGTYDNLMGVDLTLVEGEGRRWLQTVATYDFTGVATFEGDSPSAEAVVAAQVSALSDTAAVQAAVAANPALDTVTVQSIAVDDGVVTTTEEPTSSPVSGVHETKSLALVTTCAAVFWLLGGW